MLLFLDERKNKKTLDKISGGGKNRSIDIHKVQTYKQWQMQQQYFKIYNVIVIRRKYEKG